MAKNHKAGETFCSCNACSHGNALQCIDYSCNCCTGSGGRTYQITYLKDSGAVASNF